ALLSLLLSPEPDRSAVESLKLARKLTHQTLVVGQPTLIPAPLKLRQPAQRNNTRKSSTFSHGNLKYGIAVFIFRHRRKCKEYRGDIPALLRKNDLPCLRKKLRIDHRHLEICINKPIHINRKRTRD